MSWRDCWSLWSSPLSAEIEARVDALLMEQGVYDPIELLLAEGRLAYADYEAWRAREAGGLDERIFGDIERTREILESAADYAARLGLQSEHLSYIPWGGTPGQTLACSRDPGLDQLLRTRYKRADDQPQLDLFMDSGATALVNDVIAALVGRDPGEAERALQRLSDAEPGHSRLG